jgi:SAM-dependent methyltransferase
MVAILSNQRDVILDAVRAMYTDVARHPSKGFHFPTGRSAAVFVGYPEVMLDDLPAKAVESFAGVGYPFAADVIREGDTVLDVGSGSGTDVLIASRLTGRSGKVLALDLTIAMREKLLATLQAAAAHNVEVLEGNAEAIPLPDACVDVVSSNGVLNLVPDKEAAFREISRVLVDGGRLQIADIVVGTLPGDNCRAHPELWAECVVGAVREDDYVRMLTDAGLTGIEVLSRHDYFIASPSSETRKVAASFQAHGATFRARKQPQ